MTVKGKEIELEQGKDFFIGEVKKIEKQNKFIIGLNVVLVLVNFILLFGTINFFFF